MTLIKLGFEKEKEPSGTKKRFSDLLAGAAAGTIANFAVAPIDAIKDIQKMNRNTNINNRLEIEAGRIAELPESMTGVAKRLWHSPGKIQNFYRGSGTALLKVAPAAALQFMLYGIGKDVLQRKDK